LGEVYKVKDVDGNLYALKCISKTNFEKKETEQLNKLKGFFFYFLIICKIGNAISLFRYLKPLKLMIMYVY
jgi:hypothetical protein